MKLEDEQMRLKWYQPPWRDSVEFVFVTRRNGRRYVAKPIELVFEEVPENGIMEPTFRINGESSREFLEGMANSLAERGIKTDKDAKIEGTLEATRTHLEDMRKLTFDLMAVHKTNDFANSKSEGS